MTPRSRTAALFAATAACLGLAACGGDDTGDPIPSAKADRLTQRLDTIERSVEEGCVAVAVELRAAQTTVSSLDDDGVGEDVQDALANGIDNLRDVAVRECTARRDEETTPETVPETVPVEPVPPPPTETVPPPTETTPPPTETVPPPVLDDEEPDEGDGGAQFDPDAKIPPGQAKKDGEE